MGKSPRKPATRAGLLHFWSQPRVRYQVVRRGSSVATGLQVRTVNVEGSGTEWATWATPFARGEVALGQQLIVTTAAGAPVPSQGTFPAVHEDGTGRHAFISAQVTGGQLYRVVTTPALTSVLGVADLLAAVPGDIARVSLSGGITGLMTVRDLLENSTNRARLNNTSSYVILSQGPSVLDVLVAQNFDTHVRIEIQLRWYGGSLLWAGVSYYNGYVNLNGMGARTFTAVFVLNGVTKDSRTITHWNRAQWYVKAWSSAGTLYVRQAAAYLIQSKAFANYRLTTPPTDVFLNAQIQSINPLENGDLEDSLGSTGAHGWLGIDTQWGACYITSDCKVRAYRWMLANTEGAMGYQFSSLMDSATGEMLSLSDRPTFTHQQQGTLGTGYTSGISPFGNSSTGQPASHAPAAGYMAYVVTGEWAYLKSLHGWASFETFWTDSNRNRTYNGATIRKYYYGSIRGAAWNYRTVGQAAYITPDWHYLKTYYNNTTNGNFIGDYADYGPTYSSIGVVEGSEPITQYRTFMHFFLAQTTAYLVCDLGFESGRPFAAHVAKYPAGLFGNTGEYKWNFSCGQDHTVANTDAGPYYTTFTQMDANTSNVPSYSVGLAAGSQALADAMKANGDIVDNVAGTISGHAESATGYPSNARPALSYLEALGVPNAAACWTRVNGGTQPDYRSEPMFDVLPRFTTLQLASSNFPNWPTMQVLDLQGNVALNLLDPTQHPLIADHEFFNIQGFNPTPARCATRVTNIPLVWAQQDTTKIRTKIGLYMSFQQARKAIVDGNTDVQFNLINDPAEGNPNWWLRRVGGAQIEAPFNPTLFWMCTVGRGGGTNSLGETYAQAYWRKWKALLNASDTAHNLGALLSFFFQDDTHARMQTPMSVGNGTTVVTDPDFEQNGIPENITDFSSATTAGCRKWCEGHLDSKAAMEANFPGRVWFSNSARFPTDYYDGNGTPPLPISTHPMYGKLHMGLQEDIGTAGLGLVDSGTVYNYNGGGSFFHISRLLAIHQLMLCTDAQSPAGRALVCVHINTIDRTPIAADYEYARLAFAIALLNERCSVSLSISATKPLSLNEALLELGAPLATRSTGTLNESTALFVQRTADFSSGAAKFYWAEFTKGIVILRGDSPTVGVYPSADAAVVCPLPSAGPGKTWQRINESYTNPRTDRSMRVQQPTLNDGSTVTSVSLKPYHAIVLRRV